MRIHLLWPARIRASEPLGRRLCEPQRIATAQTAAGHRPALRRICASVQRNDSGNRRQGGGGWGTPLKKRSATRIKINKELQTTNLQELLRYLLGQQYGIRRSQSKPSFYRIFTWSYRALHSVEIKATTPDINASISRSNGNQNDQTSGGKSNRLMHLLNRALYALSWTLQIAVIRLDVLGNKCAGAPKSVSNGRPSEPKRVAYQNA